MWITYFFKEFIGIWQANIFLPFKTEEEIHSLTFPPDTFNIISDIKLHKIDDKGSLQYRLRGS